MAWAPIDLRSDPDVAEYRGDPGDLLELTSFLADLAVRPAWQASAACRGMGPEPWFPSRGTSTAPAKDLCATCLVRGECLDAALALSTTEDAGVWGGTSERQRKALRRAVTPAA